jgi:hypothetical protein
MLKAIPLGLITVSVAGTPILLTNALILAAGGGLPPSGGVHKIEVWAKAANSGIILVKLNNGSGTPVIVADLQVPSAGSKISWFVEGCGNTVFPQGLSIDAVSNGDGSYVTLWVE